MLKTVWILIVVTLTLYADKLVLVTNIQTPIADLTQSQVQLFYLKKRRFWGETKLVVLNLPPQHFLRKTFEHDILKMSPEELDAYWIKQHYVGHRPPYRVESVESMILFIKKVKGAIGYIPADRVDDGLKIIYE